ncbi:hypothetical protein BTS2_3198 [Bacillus sp. TS-2]|nr:hypothetical protein BTS2_3198 [Bacillus sp. TS-2]
MFIEIGVNVRLNVILFGIHSSDTPKEKWLFELASYLQHNLLKPNMQTNRKLISINKPL